jgi:hypothetical protein
MKELKAIARRKTMPVSAENAAAPQQQMPGWEDFMAQKKNGIDGNGERKPATPEQKQRMDVRLEELGGLFADSDIRWMLLGAMNISLYRGEYIGMHVDTDIGVDEDDLDKLVSLLPSKGYALFRTIAQSGPIFFEFVSARDARKDPYKLMIAAVDESGRLRDITDVALNPIDVYPLKRTEEGHLVTLLGSKLPKEWGVPQPIEFHGVLINLSPPTRVALYKLNSGRPHDTKDLQLLVASGALKSADLAEIDRIVEEEFERTRAFMHHILKDAICDLPIQTTPDNVFQRFMNQLELAERIGNNKYLIEALRSFSSHVAIVEDRSLESLLNVALAMFGIEEGRHKKIGCLSRICGERNIEVDVTLPAGLSRGLKAAVEMTTAASRE